MISEKTFAISIIVLILFSSACLNKKPIENKSSGTYQYQGNAQHTGIFRSQESPSLNKIIWQEDFSEIDENIKIYKDKYTGMLENTTSPVADENNIYFGINGYFFALDYSANLKWKTKIGATNEFNFQTNAINNNILVIVTNKGNVLALNTLTGAKKWFKKIQENNIKASSVGSPLIYKNRIFISINNKLYSIDMESGKILWEKPGAGNPSASHNNIYIIDPSLTKILAYDFRQGNSKWEYSGADRSPVIFNGNIYSALGYDYIFLAINAFNGKPRWKQLIEHQDPGFISEAASNAEGTYFFDNANGRTYAYSHNGKRLWSSNKTSAEIAPPVISGNRLYQASSSITVSDTKTGKRIKRKNLPGDVWHNLFITPKGDLLLIAGTKLMLID